MSPSTAVSDASPAAPVADGGAATPAEAAVAVAVDEAPRTGLTDLVAARLAARAAAQANTAPSTANGPSDPVLAEGKLAPGPAAWRALERHAASFRLR
jgi:hypothetical protein